MTQDTVQINENLVKIENVLTGLEYLFEEVETRKNNIFNEVEIKSIIQNEMHRERFKTEVAEIIVNNGYCRDISKEVAFTVMEKIDDSIAAFINNRVDERLRSLGIVSSNTNS